LGNSPALGYVRRCLSVISSVHVVPLN
jgi:hypothetical protein